MNKIYLTGLDDKKAVREQANRETEEQVRQIRADVKHATFDQAIAAGQQILIDEQAQLLRECRAALDDLIRKRPGIQSLLCGSTTIGNLRAELSHYRRKNILTAAREQEKGE